MHVIHPMGLPQVVSKQDVVSAPKHKLLPQMQNWEPAVIPHCASGLPTPALLTPQLCVLEIAGPTLASPFPFLTENCCLSGLSCRPACCPTSLTSELPPTPRTSSLGHSPGVWSSVLCLQAAILTFVWGFPHTKQSGSNKCWGRKEKVGFAPCPCRQCQCFTRPPQKQAEAEGFGVSPVWGPWGPETRAGLEPTHPGANNPGLARLTLPLGCPS